MICREREIIEPFAVLGLPFLMEWNTHAVSALQIFEEEYNVWFLDWGGALVALKHTSMPIRHLW